MRLMCANEKRCAAWPVNADDPRGDIVAVDNAKGRGNADVAPLDALPRASENRFHETLKTPLDAEHQAGIVSDNP